MNRYFALTVLLCLVTPGAAGAADDAKPNIVFIFADDQCFQTINALGYDEIQTPNLGSTCTARNDVHARLQHGLVERCGLRGQPHDAELAADSFGTPTRFGTSPSKSASKVDGGAST